MQATLQLSERRPWRERCFPNGEWILLVALAFEVAVFSALNENFFSTANFFEVVRLSVELGLLALALTPVMITGGIDLSVGSMMGLAAVVFGAAWRDGGLPIVAAALIALALGCAGGALNAVLITRLKIPPIIVTLGSFSHVPRDRRRADARGGELQRISRRRSCGWGRAIWWSRDPGAAAAVSGGAGGIRGAAAPLGDRPRRCTRSGSARGARATRASGWSGGWRWCTCFRDSPRAWRRSSMSRTWGRRNRTRARGTNWRRSRRWCWAARRCSAGAERYGARCSDCFRSRCCRTGCGLRRCPRN